MKLNELATQKCEAEQRIATNSAYYAAYEVHDNELKLVIRPHERFLSNEAFMNAFRYLGPLTQSFTHPALLRCELYGEDQRGPFWTLTPGRFISLEQTLSEQVSLRFNKRWVNRFTLLLTRAVQYLNNQQELALELTPSALLLTRDNQHLPVLLPPLSPFLSVKEQIYEHPTTHQYDKDNLPPELFNAEAPDARTDVFGMGNLLRHIHPCPKPPQPYLKAIELATNERMNIRPASPAAFLKIIYTDRRRKLLLYNILCVTFMVIFAVVAFTFAHTGWTRSSSETNLPATPLPATQEVTTVQLDSTTALSPESLLRHQEQMNVSVQKFRSAFRLQVQSILKRVYTPNNFIDEDTFMSASMEAQAQILSLQETLAAQFQLDPTTAQRIAAEVYDEVASELKPE